MEEAAANARDVFKCICPEGVQVETCGEQLGVQG